MSNKTQLQTNNTALDALITRVNAAKDVAASLPEAGSSGGDVAIETCTVRIEFDSGVYFGSYAAQICENGTISTYVKYGSGAYSSSQIIINNVIVGTAIMIETNSSISNYFVQVTNAQIIEKGYYTIYVVPNVANDTAIIGLTPIAGGGN